MPVGAQPTDQFERGLGEALDGFVQQGERFFLFRQGLLLLFEALLFARAFRRVHHAQLLVVILQQEQQVMGQTHELRLHFFGGDTRCPGLLLLEFGLGFIKDLLDFPAGFIEQGQQTGLGDAGSAAAK